MPGITRYTQHVFGSGLNYFYGPAISFNQIIWGRRNGIGKKVVAPSATSTTVPVTAHKFERVSFTPGSIVNTTTQYFVRISMIDVLTVRTEKFQVGPTVTAGNEYKITKNGVTATYIALSGDTAADVVIGLDAAISGTVFTPAYTSITNNGINTLTLRGNTSYSSTPQLYRPALAYYQNGYYIPSSSLPSPTEWLILSHTQTAGFYSLPSLAASYAYSSLIPLPGGLINYLTIPGTTDLFIDTNVSSGATDITSVPSAPSAIDANTLVFDEVTTKVIVNSSVPFINGERINLFYT